MRQAKGFAKIEATLAVVALALAGFVAWYVLYTKQAADEVYNNRVSTAVPSVSSKSAASKQANEYDDWKTFTSDSGNLSFKYPGTWFIREDASLARVYAASTKTSLTMDDIPENFQQVWIAINTNEASAASEANAKKGTPEGYSVNGKPTVSTITANGITIRTYEYQTVGGPVLLAYWSGKTGTRYFATNSTEVGQTNQQNMVQNLKKILASVTAN
jgi:hypothetical protein